eukprot:CAMPEP_0184008458 /NCGR_PEP_ID=MMETSP0954-20121128/1987_1 /TAXON_ID=627963 /ORGANISM="Aplanochytrium sp, Strain PBS07" /LENGTH=431 /DNA_ID=CAMNT_0026287575 /DNA_START=57 /DNA_END=1349 /DNA_ORIENTATION=-
MSLSILPIDLAKAMSNAGVKRGYVCYDAETRSVVASHSVLQPVVDMVSNDKVDYDEHEGLFFEVHKNCLMGAFLWKTNRGQGCGGIRLRKYENLDQYLRDGIRLAIGMGRKSAMAGIWWGGGKGVIAYSEENDIVGENRKQLMLAYGDFLTSLKGCYVAAEDAGMHVKDLDIVYQRSRYLTCISPSLGGSGNPSVPTAMGIVCAMEGVLSFLEMGTLEGKRIAVQGVGNVGDPLISFLLEKGAGKIIASEYQPERLKQMQEKYSGYSNVSILPVGKDPNSVLYEDVDIVSPCAYGGVLNEITVPKIKAKIVCGAANNQLLDPSTDYGMTKNGLIYCPDFVVNRMGIVNCADEHAGRAGSPLEDPLIAKHLGRSDPNSVFNIIQSVLKNAKEQDISTAKAADDMANKLALENHPIFGHRSIDIIKYLMNNGW